MNVALRRANLLVCVLAGALAVAIALVVARGASAAPPEPIDDNFTLEGFCDFDVLVEGTGQGKLIELPGDRLLGISPGLRTTLTNAEEPTHQVSYVITGAAHVTELESGEWLVVLTGRNVVFLPEEGILLTIGRFNQVTDPETGESTPPEGKGRVIDVCEQLA